MSEPFLAEIRIVGFNFAPRGWAYCDGQLLPINQNQSLFSLLGTTYGGDGRTSFGLPDLRGRTPIHVGAGHSQGQKAGEEAHSLSEAEMPSHDHVAQGTSNNATANTGVGNVLAKATGTIHADAQNLVDLDPTALANAGANQSHNNMQPYLVLGFVIALQGLFPSRN